MDIKTYLDRAGALMDAADNIETASSLLADYQTQEQTEEARQKLEHILTAIDRLTALLIDLTNLIAQGD